MAFRHSLFAVFASALVVGGACYAQPAADEARLAAFQEAAFYGKSDIVQAMLDEGVAVNGLSAEQKSALMWAAFNGHEETVRILLKCGADIALRDDMGRTALMYSSTAPSPGTVRLLLDAGADVNQRDTDEGFTALMFAAAEGNDEVVKLLLDAGADSGLKDVDGDTALDFATKRGQLKTIEILNARAAPSASLSESAQERDGSDAGEVEAEAPEAVAPPASLPSH